jgi:hypothetical protein
MVSEKARDVIIEDAAADASAASAPDAREGRA